MAGIDEITTALKATLGDDGAGGGITKLTAYAIEPPSPKFPCVWPFFRTPAADYDQTFDGAMTWHLTLTIAVQAVDIAHAQTNLKPYLSPIGDKSIKAAIEDDVTLGLPGVYANVLRVDQIGPLQVAGATAWAATIPVDVMVSAV